MKVQKQFGKKVKFVRHDGAREFATNSLKDFYEDEGIEQQTTVSVRAPDERHGRASLSELSSRSAAACCITLSWTSGFWG
ncbi:hypothetical protein Pcac1_g29506 [Phytophthora cactorum]|nr:hypothetical protein Pcac1_g29506 [Phytophthora cactorum]